MRYRTGLSSSASGGDDDDRDGGCGGAVGADLGSGRASFRASSLDLALSSLSMLVFMVSLSSW